MWDAPTRVFHWLLALCFTGAYLTSESSRLLAVHLTLGYTMVGLVTFRLVWGLIGTRYARFSNFVRGPQAVTRYASKLMHGHSVHHTGHNPLGAVSIVLMLLCSLAIIYTGWLYFNGGAHSLKEIHEATAGLMLTLVGIHVMGVLLGCVLQGENLISAMVHGRKHGQPKDSVRWSWWPVALLILSVVLGYWWLQWQAPPVSAPSQQSDYDQGERSKYGQRGDDDDD